MVQNHMIRFRVSRMQLEQIRQDALDKGFANPSAYMRDLALNRSFFLETRLVEITQDVKRIRELLE